MNNITEYSSTRRMKFIIPAAVAVLGVASAADDACMYPGATKNTCHNLDVAFGSGLDLENFVVVPPPYHHRQTVCVGDQFDFSNQLPEAITDAASLRPEANIDIGPAFEDGIFKSQDTLWTPVATAVFVYGLLHDLFRFATINGQVPTDVFELVPGLPTADGNNICNADNDNDNDNSTSCNNDSITTTRFIWGDLGPTLTGKVANQHKKVAETLQWVRKKLSRQPPSERRARVDRFVELAITKFSCLTQGRVSQSSQAMVAMYEHIVSRLQASMVALFPTPLLRDVMNHLGPQQAFATDTLAKQVQEQKVELQQQQDELQQQQDELQQQQDQFETKLQQQQDQFETKLQQQQDELQEQKYLIQTQQDELQEQKDQFKTKLQQQQDQFETTVQEQKDQIQTQQRTIARILERLGDEG